MCSCVAFHCSRVSSQLLCDEEHSFILGCIKLHRKACRSMIYGLSVQCVSFIALPTIGTMQCISIKYYLRSTARSAVHWPQRCVTSLSILLLLPALVPCPAGSFRKFTSKIDNNHHDSCVIVSFIFHWVSSKSVPYTLKSSVAVHHLNSDCIFKCQPQNCCWLPPRSFFWELPNHSRRIRYRMCSELNYDANIIW